MNEAFNGEDPADYICEDCLDSIKNAYFAGIADILILSRDKAHNFKSQEQFNAKIQGLISQIDNYFCKQAQEWEDIDRQMDEEIKASLN